MGVMQALKRSGKLRYYHHSFTRKKTLEDALRDIATDGAEHSLKRCLNAFDLTSFGVGSMIGAGIFVMTGVAAQEKAGPAITVSYAIAGLACVFAALCYAELACRVPSSGSAYSYSYITIGEFVAWIIGWDLTLEYMIATSTVARGWSGYLKSLLHSVGVYLPDQLSHIHVSDGWGEGEVFLDPTAAISVLILTVILALGVKESIKLTTVMVAIKLAIIIFVIGAGASFADKHNWSDFNPYGFKGISNGAAVIFFAYLGFDMVVNIAEETKNPQRDLPIGILCSLVISTSLYVAVAAVVTLMTLYSEINIESPLASAFAQRGWKWAEGVISLGAFCGLTTAQITGLVSQPRLYYSLSRDGLLPRWFLYIHPRFKTPFYATLFSGACAAVITFIADIELLSDMSSIGTLLAFTIVASCTIIIRYTEPPAPETNAAPGGGTDTTDNIEVEKHDTSSGDIALEDLPASETQSQASNDIIELAGTSTGKWSTFRTQHLETRSPITLVILVTAFAFATFISLRWDAPIAITIILFICLLIPASMMFFLKSKNLPKTFSCPGMPLIPLISIMFNIYLMVNLSFATWVRLIVWLLIGLGVYFAYGIKHSKLSQKNYINLVND